MSEHLPSAYAIRPPQAAEARLWVLLGIALILATFLSSGQSSSERAAPWRGAEMLAAADHATDQECVGLAGYDSAHHCCSDAACMATMIVAPMALPIAVSRRVDGGDRVLFPAALTPPTFFHPPIFAVQG